MDPDDEVFLGDIDICNEADTKLVDWSFNVFIPACRTLLYHCADGDESELASGQVLADLRSLSNTVYYFCTEQQRLSGQLRFNVRGISSSLSTDRFTKIRDKAKNLEPLLSNGNTASMSSDSASSSGFESQDSQYDRSYAVKILRSVSQSLIAPLLQDSEEGGFTSDLYKSIVQAIQKIAWKVEACLSFNDPSKEFNIYSEIFDDEQKSRLSVMMIRALPPEEPKLKNSAGCSSRSGSLSAVSKNAAKEEGYLEMEKEPARIIRRTPSGRARPGGMVMDSNSLSLDKQDSLDKLDENRNSSSLEYENGHRFDVRLRLEEPPDRRLRRINTIASPDRKLRNASKDWSSFDENPNDPKDRSRDSPQYFRPTHYRRTTISLSRKEVSKLGLNVTKRVDDSIAALSHESAEGGTGHREEGVEMEKVKSRLHEVLDSRAVRNRSASTSDLLDDNLEASKSFQTEKDNLTAPKKKLSLDSPTLDKNLDASYMPVNRKSSDSHTTNDSQEFPGDWTLMPDPDMPLEMDKVNAGMGNSIFVIAKGSKNKSGKAKKQLDKSLSASGRFRERVRKTAQALRKGSISYSSSSKKKQLTTSMVSGSMDQLLEESAAQQEQRVDQGGAGAASSYAGGKHHKKGTSMSEPASPLPKSDTIPQNKQRLLTRLRPKSSKSVGSTNSLKRKRKPSGPKSGFLSNTQPDSEMGVAALTESIYALSNNAVQPSPSDSKLLHSAAWYIHPNITVEPL